MESVRPAGLLFPMSLQLSPVLSTDACLTSWVDVRSVTPIILSSTIVVNCPTVSLPATANVYNAIQITFSLHWDYVYLRTNSAIR